MKPAYIFILSFVLFGFGLKPGIAYASTDTITSFPFVEDWSSCSFDTNGWTFPYSQGNWTILTGEGNPAPCAGFTGYPSNSNYIYALESAWFDARTLTCDQLFLNFDLDLDTLNNTGLEKLAVYLVTDTAEYLLATIKNNVGIEWTEYQYNLHKVRGNYFKVRFVAFGHFSPDIIAWELDNISILRKCDQVEDALDDSWGNCNYTDPECYVLLSWRSPLCDFDQPTQFAFDDGTAENGICINPGYTCWLGNEFPIASWYTGMIQSFEIWFGFGPPNSELLTIDVFDGSQTLVGSSESFTTPTENWATVNCNDIPFTGMFYAMVKWDSVPSQTNYFGMDEDGSYASDDLEWYFDGMTWEKLSNMGFNPGVFLIRVNVLLNGKKGSLMPDGQFILETDSSEVIGYNVYRKEYLWSGWEPTYNWIGYNIAQDTTLEDTIYCLANYYITAVYSNNCESEPVYLTYGPGCFSGITDNTLNMKIIIHPNPADNEIRIRSEISFSEIYFYSLTGKLIQETVNDNSKERTVDVSNLPSGFYTVMIRTKQGTAAQKLIIRR